MPDDKARIHGEKGNGQLPCIKDNFSCFHCNRIMEGGEI